MSSSCPPQLQLTLQPNTTSFKRSFEQFGFDLASPVEGSEGSSNDGNDRNKRARSETSFSDSTDSTDSSQSSLLASASSNSLSPSRPVVTSFGPPRLPTPDIEDIQMPDYPNHERRDHFSSQNEARYRLSLGSFNTEHPVQPSQPSSPALPRLPTPPPVLPPLAISEGQPRSTAISFLHTPSQPATPLTDVSFDGRTPSRATVQSTPADDSELIQGFRARLSGALERLVPQSPLVPGLELDDREEQHTSNRHSLQESTSLEVPPEPPVLPPIPSMSTTADIDHFNIEALLTGEGPVHSLSSMRVPSTSRPSISPSLDTHPLPSPILRDLRSWMDGQERPAVNGFANPTSRHWSLHTFDSTSPSALSNIVPSSTQQLTGMPDNSDHNGLMDELSSQSTNFPRETGLWERRSFELGNSTHDEATYSDNSSRRSITRPSSSPDISWLDRPPRLQNALRRRSRLGSSTSLVTENSLEARRMADHDHVVRDLHAGMRRRMDDIDMDVPRSDSIEPAQDDILSRLDFGRSHAPHVLHLPPLPTPSLDVAPEGEEVRPELGHATGPPIWYHAAQEPSNHDWREQPIHSLPDNFIIPSHFMPGSRDTSAFSQYPRPSSPVQPSPPVAVLPTNSFTWVPRNHRAPVGDAYNRRPHINLTRHLTLSHRREPPPLLPPPDFGHAFVTEGRDRDVEMGMTSQPPGQPHGQFYPYSGATSPSAAFTYLQQPRPYREENSPTQSYVLHSPQNPSQSRPPPQFHQHPTLLGDSPVGPLIRQQRQTPQPVQQPPEVAGRPRPQLARVLRFALPQSEEVGRYSGSSSPVRIPEQRMPPLPANIHLDNRTEHQPPSPSQSVHRPAEPRYVSGPPMVENVDRRRDSLPAYSPATLDPAVFAPGPFRNTIHQTFYPRLNLPTAPTIPPLPFQETAPNSHLQSDAVHAPSPSEEAYPPRGFFSRDEQPEFNYSLRVRRPGQNMEQRALPRPPFASTRAFSINRPADDNTTGVRRRMPFSSTAQEARIETPRMADLLPSDNGYSTHRRYSLPPRSDPMHPNPTIIPRQQFMNLLHQHVEGERRRASEDPREAMHTEGPPANGIRPASSLPPRRFGAVDLEHFQSWRTRTRGRFRITPEFLATRLRPGNMGDFIHDDDFDDSYENLINLAVTIGDVKPKSTPSEILEKLDKGVYKDWKTADGDKRCPICLDDYTDHDILLKLNDCHHWFHQTCLKQWLHSANTCPVCRKSVHNLESSPSSPRRASRRFSFWRGGAPPPPPNSSGGGGGGDEGSSNRPRNNGNIGTNNRWSSPLRRRFD